MSYHLKRTMKLCIITYSGNWKFYFTTDSLDQFCLQNIPRILNLQQYLKPYSLTQNCCSDEGLKGTIAIWIHHCLNREPLKTALTVPLRLLKLIKWIIIFRLNSKKNIKVLPQIYILRRHIIKFKLSSSNFKDIKGKNTK